MHIATLIDMGCYDIMNKRNFGGGILGLHGLLVMDMRRWLKYNSGGKRSTPTSRIASAKHDSRMLLRKDNENIIAWAGRGQPCKPDNDSG